MRCARFIKTREFKVKEGKGHGELNYKQKLIYVWNLHIHLNDLPWKKALTGTHWQDITLLLSILIHFYEKNSVGLMFLFSVYASSSVNLPIKVLLWLSSSYALNYCKNISYVSIKAIQTFPCMLTFTLTKLLNI